MRIFVTGGTGFVGRNLVSRLVKEGNQVTVLTRSAKATDKTPPSVSYVQGNPMKQGSWQEAVGEHDVVINLAGASLFKRWTAQYKRAIRESRIETTRRLVEGMRAPPGQTVFFSTSAVGYYGFRGDEELTEDSPAGDDFLAKVAGDWEREALKAEEKGVRVVITRFGIVLGDKGGVLSQMVPLFRRYIGGPIGNGKQWFSWIHIEDLMEVFVFLINHPEISGPVNVCSPNPIRNEDLAKALGVALHRPSFLSVPGFLLTPVLGEFGSIILKGQKVIPRRLMDSGFPFQHAQLEQALGSILG
ncbi:MAG: epimerase [Latescibacteria bacterium DG_63]|nr:MAG: epimerase [Latescibacteria bacterium DG_63]